MTKYKNTKLYYWLSPICSMLVQAMILLSVFLYYSKQDPDAGFAMFATFILYSFMSLIVLAISYIFLWAINRFRVYGKYFLGILITLFILLWVLIFYKTELYKSSITHLLLSIIWIMLYIIPLWISTRLYVFKNR